MALGSLLCCKEIIEKCLTEILETFSHVVGRSRAEEVRILMVLKGIFFIKRSIRNVCVSVTAGVFNQKWSTLLSLLQ